MFTGSLSTSFGVMVMPPKIFPSSPTIENYKILLGVSSFFAWFKNTVFVVVSITILSVFVTATGGYAFAFYEFKGKKILWIILLAGLMVPRIALIVPLFVVINRLGLSGTLLAAVLPAIFAPMSLYLARIYFESMPRSILESSRLDGANELQVLIKIVMPVSKPILALCAVFAANGSLGDYIWQMLVLQKESMQTMVVGLTRTIMLSGVGRLINLNPVGLPLASGMILLAPLLIIFICANKYFTSAIGGIE